MKFTVEVGGAEKARIEFSRNWFTGAMATLVNGKLIAHADPLAVSTHFSTRVIRHLAFTVGNLETHDVVIETERPLLLAGLRPQIYRVFVDGVLRHQQRGY